MNRLTTLAVKVARRVASAGGRQREVISVCLALLVALLPMAGAAAPSATPQQEMERLTRQYQADRRLLENIIETPHPLPDYFMLLRDIDDLERALRQFEGYLAKLNEEQNRSATSELQVQASRVLVGDQSGSYTIRAPDGFDAPYTVRVAGGGLIVQKSSDPLRGSFHGLASPQDSSHTLSFLLKDAQGRVARGLATVTIRGLDARTLTSQQPSEALYSSPPGQQTEALPALVADDGEDYVARYRQIRETYEQESQRIREQRQRNQDAIRERYQYGKPAPAPAWQTPGPVASPMHSARPYPIDASDCRSRFYGCSSACEKGARSTYGSCISGCGSADHACKRSKCPGGAVSGVGWNLTCTPR